MMTLSSCFCHPQGSLKAGLVLVYRTSSNTQMSPCSSLVLESACCKPFSKQAGVIGINLGNGWSCLGRSRFIMKPRLRSTVLNKKNKCVFALWVPASQVATSVFTLGTAAVLPYYTLMVVAPKAQVTKRSMESSMPYFVLGVLYAYLLYLSWTPDTLRYMFGNKYMMPELHGIAKMFTNEMTLASAWIHLLAVDLFAARQVYHDGLQNNIETRHSISLCLLFCPIGILTHFITKTLSRSVEKNENHIHY